MFLYLFMLLELFCYKWILIIVPPYYCDIVATKRLVAYIVIICFFRYCLLVCQVTRFTKWFYSWGSIVYIFHNPHSTRAPSEKCLIQGLSTRQMLQLHVPQLLNNWIVGTYLLEAKESHVLMQFTDVYWCNLQFF